MEGIWFQVELGHGLPLRADRAAEGVTERGPGVFRAGECCGCNFRKLWSEEVANLLDAHLRRRIGNGPFGMECLHQEKGPARADPFSCL